MRETREIELAAIVPNPYQPRLVFDDAALQELAKSIQENGLIQPIVVREGIGGYEIIAGERRYRAAQLAGLQTVTCVVMEAGEVEMAQLALVENIQRENLNPIEEAKAYVQMMRMSGMTQSQLATKMGKTQSTVANKIRLLNLADEVQQGLRTRTISERHARAMLSLTNEQQVQMLHEITTQDWTVSQTEQAIEQRFAPEKRKKKKNMRKAFTRNMQIAKNTILQAVSLIKQAAIPVAVEEEDRENEYIITITIKK